MKPSKEYLIWLAGFFDGEGSVGIWSKGIRRGKKYYSVGVNVCQKNEEIIKEIHSYYPEGFLHAVRNKAGVYTFTISGNSTCERFLRDILPYLRVKKTKVEEVLEYIDSAKETQRHFGMYRDSKGQFTPGHKSFVRG